MDQEKRNIYTGIMGTIAFHLLLVVIFLVARIDKVRTKHKDQIVIEFDETLYKNLQQIIEESKPKNTDIPSLSQEDVKNIAVNTASKIEEKISTEKYIDQLKEELGIDELNQQLDRSMGDEPVIESEKKEKPKEPVKKKIYKGPTRISYSLKGRTDRYIHIPVYQCQGNGNVVIEITVDPEGRVINTSVASSTTREDCVMETALDAARRSLFNIDLKAESRQRGTLTFEFVAQ